MNLGPQNSYLALPPAGRGQGVLVLHAWWGLNDFMRALCDRLAAEGFVALAPDLFNGQVARTVAEAKALVSQPGEGAASLVQAAVADLRRHPAVTGEGVAVVGFSYGGYWALWLAAAEPEAVRAVTIFYSTGEGDFPRSQAAFQGHFAENDPFEPEEGVRALETSLNEAGRPTTFYTYPGTGHWFFESDRPDAFDAPAAALAWDRTVAFLKKNLEA